jgi:hypothetical protein
MSRYGDGVGMYRTPAIIACFPSINKFILQADDKFILAWPRDDLVGSTSIVAVHGKSHARLRSYIIMNSINHPDSLRRIALHVQPRMVAALQSWAQRGKIKARDEIKKVILVNRTYSPLAFRFSKLLNVT